MVYKVTKSKDESLEQLKALIAAFEKERSIYETNKYIEAQLRIDFINPLLKTFGWDVDNEKVRSQYLRDVIQEESIDITEEDAVTKRNPDYTLRVKGARKIFIETKKVSVDIESSPRSAFQIRRYGWNAKMGISILTNFDKLVIYDCRFKPQVFDMPTIARYCTFTIVEYLSRFDELYDLISFHAVSSGSVDAIFPRIEKETIAFDDYFLEQIETWRYKLGNEIMQRNININEGELNCSIQRLLNRIIFLRICEDREIEKYESLKKVKCYDDLKCLFIQSDKKYNSGLFDFIEDTLSLKIDINSSILLEIFSELYYPNSPYNFSVIDPIILSQIYEKYLGSKISIDVNNRKEISITEEPEVAASSGVVPTPKLIVDNIVKETLSPLYDNAEINKIAKLKIADICCGSGTFLLSVFDFILDKTMLLLAKNEGEDNGLIYKSSDGAYYLTLKAKQDILVNNIFGVDINPYAVEVTKFSLFLKLLENENKETIENYLLKDKSKALPNLDANIKCGNSLIDTHYYQYDHESIKNNELLFKVKPFDWQAEFPFLIEKQGFDAIVGNPPYIRIQNMAKYSGEEIKYYQSKESGYLVAASDTFDKYYLFIQRAIDLLSKDGMMGYIVPNKFFVLKGGRGIRKYISSNSSLYKILHFGVSQVFPNRSTYTAILILHKGRDKEFGFKKIKQIVAELNAESLDFTLYNNQNFKAHPWIFVSKETQKIFDKLNGADTVQLNAIAEIAVGLQTSADKVYIFKPKDKTATTYTFDKDGVEYEVERAICKPFLDLSFGLFDSIKPNAQIIFPYEIVVGKAMLIAEKDFLNQYPLTWAYLNKHKDLLSKRDINGSKKIFWYQYGRSQSLVRFHNTPKLIWPVLSIKPCYIYDKNDVQFTGGGNGPYYSLLGNSEYSLLFLMGILSHPLFEAMIKSGASEFRGAYYSHGRQFIEKLPIKKIDFNDKGNKNKHDEIVSVVEQLILTKDEFNRATLNANKDVLQRKLDYLNDELINKVNGLYNVTAKEIETVLHDEMLIAEVEED